MKKFIQWLAKVFGANITETVIETRIVEKVVALEGTIDGDVTVKGNLKVEGTLNVTGSLCCLKKEE